ncbi:hypothetical protein V6N12_045880 [Hibiscus sabdariffa]|uniref:Uncharacterized protein n=1 Tax=Hibiscus sabdariffa TaxID=183260 RepID=A0ABR2G403_9ROSI
MHPSMEEAVLTNLLTSATLTNDATTISDMVDDFGQWRWHLFDLLLPTSILLQLAVVKPLFGLQIPD